MLVSACISSALMIEIDESHRKRSVANEQKKISHMCFLINYIPFLVLINEEFTKKSVAINNVINRSNSSHQQKSQPKW